jgi:ribose transport system substrate-binding protein
MAQQPYMMGQLAVKNAIQILQGKGSKIPALQYQDAVLVNKGNVATNNPAKFYGPNATK